MLRQAVRALLLHQNRLTYCSLLFTVRQLGVHTFSWNQCPNGGNRRIYSDIVCKSIVRVNTSKTSCRCFHYSVTCSRTHKKFKQKDRQGIVTNEWKVTSDNESFHSDSENVNDKTAENLDSKLRNTCANSKQTKVENAGEDVFDNDCVDNFEDFEKSVIPFDSQDVKTEEPDKGRLIAVETYYRPRSITEGLLDKDSESVNDAGKDTAELDIEHGLALAEKGELDLGNVKKVEFPPLTNFAPIVNETEVLKQLVMLGVDLSEIQKKGMAEHILQMDFEKDVAGYVWLLKDTGVASDMVGKVITRCPWIFQHSLNNLRVRIDYLRSKKFNKATIANMVMRDPKFLCMSVERIDAKLGFLQQEFQLTGNQIREKVGGLSKLIVEPKHLIKKRKFYLKKILGFTDQEVKTMFLTYPKVFLYTSEYIAEKFDYLHNVMELPHDMIAKMPQALNTTRHKLESRHRFLVKCGRAQYDPKKENYVSLMALITGKDETWCFEVAKSSVADYNQFLKCI